MFVRFNTHVKRVHSITSVKGFSTVTPPFIPPHPQTHRTSPTSLEVMGHLGKNAKGESETWATSTEKGCSSDRTARSTELGNASELDNDCSYIGFNQSQSPAAGPHSFPAKPPHIDQGYNVHSDDHPRHKQDAASQLTLTDDDSAPSVDWESSEFTSEAANEFFTKEEMKFDLSSTHRSPDWDPEWGTDSIPHDSADTPPPGGVTNRGFTTLPKRVVKATNSDNAPLKSRLGHNPSDASSTRTIPYDDPLLKEDGIEWNSTTNDFLSKSKVNGDLVTALRSPDWDPDCGSTTSFDESADTPPESTTYRAFTTLSAPKADNNNKSRSAGSRGLHFLANLKVPAVANGFVRQIQTQTRNPPAFVPSPTRHILPTSLEVMGRLGKNANGESETWASSAEKGCSSDRAACSTESSIMSELDNDCSYIGFNQSQNPAAGPHAFPAEPPHIDQGFNTQSFSDDHSRRKLDDVPPMMLSTPFDEPPFNHEEWAIEQTAANEFFTCPDGYLPSSSRRPDYWGCDTAISNDSHSADTPPPTRANRTFSTLPDNKVGDYSTSSVGSHGSHLPGLNKQLGGNEKELHTFGTNLSNTNFVDMQSGTDIPCNNANRTPSKRDFASLSKFVVDDDKGDLKLLYLPTCPQERDIVEHEFQRLKRIRDHYYERPHVPWY